MPYAKCVAVVDNHVTVPEKCYVCGDGPCQIDGYATRYRAVMNASNIEELAKRRAREVSSETDKAHRSIQQEKQSTILEVDDEISKTDLDQLKESLKAIPGAPRIMREKSLIADALKDATKESELSKEIQTLLNCYSVENHSDTPDFVLAQYMMASLNAFNAAVVAREKWYGREAGNVK